MNERLGPVRTCIGCRMRREQNRMTRFVPGADGRPIASRTAPGRGAWICTESTSCRETAEKKRAFDRAWKTRTTMKSRTTMAH